MYDDTLVNRHRYSRKTWRAPAVIALLIQILSLVVLLLACKIFASYKNLQIDLLFFAGTQGMIAALLSYFRRLDPWWIGIQFCFPLLLVVATTFELPANFFLICFAVSLLLYWSTFRTQVPYFPSSREVWLEVAALLPEAPVRVIDIGSGLGGLLLNLAKTRPDSQFVGVELAPLPWSISWFRAKLAGGNVRFVLADYENVNFGEFDLVFAYLAPPAMEPLWEKALREMRPGSLLLSYEFEIPNISPDFQKMIKSRQVMLYGWRF